MQILGIDFVTYFEFFKWTEVKTNLSPIKNQCVRNHLTCVWFYTHMGVCTYEYKARQKG